VRLCVLTSLVLLGFGDLAEAQTAAPHYVASTVAGHVPADTGVGLTQYLDSPAAVVYGAKGLYFATLYRIWRLNADGTITPIAGTGSFTSASNGDGGPATQATFGGITELAIDASHNMYVADGDSIRRITPDGKISTFAGNGTYPGSKSNAGGPAASVGICPGGLAVSSDTLYASDACSQSIIAFSLDGKKSSVIGGNNASGLPGDGGPATKATFYFVGGLALWNNKLFISDRVLEIRQIDLSTGIVTAVPGAGGSFCGVVSYLCYFPDRLAVSSDGKLYLNSSTDFISVLDLVNGTTQTPFVSLNPNTEVFPPLTEYVRGVAVDPLTGAVAYADQGTHKISLATGIDQVQTLVGITHFSGDEGPAPLALLDTTFIGFGPAGIAAGTDGSIYFSDGNNNRIRKITPDGIIHTIAGTGVPNFAGDGGPAADAQLYQPADLRLDAFGSLYFVDTVFERIRKIDPTGMITTVAGSGVGGGLPAEGVPATDVELSARSLAIDAAGTLYFGGLVSNQVWKIDNSGLLSLVAGANIFGAFSGDGELAVNTDIGDSSCLATDHFGNLFICEVRKNRIRKVDSQGIITTIAGNGNFPVFGEKIMNGSATAVAIGQPGAAAADSAGNLYVASNPGQIFRVDTSGQLTVVAGAFGNGPGDGGDALRATFSNVTGLAFDAAGNLYVNESERIRKLTPIGPDGILSDFNGDGRTDVIWQDPVTGLMQAWFLAGAQGADVGGAAGLSASSTWAVVGVGDFNRDGFPDVVLQEPATGAAQVWFLGGTGTTVIGATTLSKANSWRIVAVADFNGDGQPDLIWQDPATGAAQIWLMSGTQGTAIAGAVPLAENSAWRIVGTGDFNGDGHPDVLWQDPLSGAAQVWYLSGTSGNGLTGAAQLAGSNTWRIRSVGDFNNDGHPDVVWQDPVTGASQVWFLNGAQGTALMGAATLSGPNGWRIAGPR
jgi:hypothetical protein